MQDNSPFSYPPRIVRAVLVAGVYALLGAITGLMLGLFLPFRHILLVAGIGVSATVGFLN